MSSSTTQASNSRSSLSKAANRVSAPKADTGDGLNLVVLVGSVFRPPEFRQLKDGRSVTSFDLKTKGPERYETVRVSWFDAPALALDYSEDDGLAVVGRVRRFWYGGRQSITDVVADSVTPVRSVARVRRALGDAMAALQHVSP